MYWLDGFTLDDNLITSSLATIDSNDEQSDNNRRKSGASASSSTSMGVFRSTHRRDYSNNSNTNRLTNTTKANTVESSIEYVCQFQSSYLLCGNNDSFDNSNSLRLCGSVCVFFDPFHQFSMPIDEQKRS
uniref:Uncharacterized protein n=1 Tax=Glossina austeni TaxID=7395 RepID=A0A1A9VD00_GLOAU